jgi:hypothetical protein
MYSHFELARVLIQLLSERQTKTGMMEYVD